jgi:hypothetical protein
VELGEPSYTAGKSIKLALATWKYLTVSVEANICISCDLVIPLLSAYSTEIHLTKHILKGSCFKEELPNAYLQKNVFKNTHRQWNTWLK